MPLSKMFRKRRSHNDKKLSLTSAPDVPVDVESKSSTSEAVDVKSHEESQEKNCDLTETVTGNQTEGENSNILDIRKTSIHEDAHEHEDTKRNSSPELVDTDKPIHKKNRSLSCQEQEIRSSMPRIRRRKCDSESKASNSTDDEGFEDKIFQLRGKDLEKVIGQCVNKLIRESIETAVKSVNVDSVYEEVIKSISRSQSESSDSTGCPETIEQKTYTDSVSEYADLGMVHTFEKEILEETLDEIDGNVQNKGSISSAHNSESTKCPDIGLQDTDHVLANDDLCNKKVTADSLNENKEKELFETNKCQQNKEIEVHSDTSVSPSTKVSDKNQDIDVRLENFVHAPLENIEQNQLVESNLDDLEPEKEQITKVLNSEAETEISSLNTLSETEVNKLSDDNEDLDYPKEASIDGYQADFEESMSIHSAVSESSGENVKVKFCVEVTCEDTKHQNKPYAEDLKNVPEKSMDIASQLKFEGRKDQKKQCTEDLNNISHQSSEKASLVNCEDRTNKNGKFTKDLSCTPKESSELVFQVTSEDQNKQCIESLSNVPDKTSEVLSQVIHEDKQLQNQQCMEDLNNAPVESLEAVPQVTYEDQSEQFTESLSNSPDKTAETISQIIREGKKIQNEQCMEDINNTQDESVEPKKNLDVEVNLMTMSGDDFSQLLTPTESIVEESVKDLGDDLPEHPLIEEEKKVNWKVGYLHVKLPHKTRGKGHLKVWKKRCVAIQPDEFANDPANPCLVLSVYSGESGAARKPSASFWKSVSSQKALVYRSSSRTHPYAFTVADDQKAVVHLAADSEALSQEWMAAIRTILWPPSPVVQLEKMLNGRQFEISLIDNDFSYRAGLLGMYGYLTITPKKLILVHPQQGYVIQEWYLNTIDKFQLMHQTRIEDVHKVLAMTTCSDSSTGKGDILIFCKEAVSLLQEIASTIHQILTHHSKQEGGKYQKELEDIGVWLVPLSATPAEDYYKVPPKQVQSLLDIPNFIFDKPVNPEAKVACPSGEAMDNQKSPLDAPKTTSTRTSQESGISSGIVPDDFLNCSVTSFVVGGGNLTGKSSDSELSDSYSPPHSPKEQRKKESQSTDAF